MKQIIVVSDSHQNNQALEYILKLYPNAFLYLHAGDSEEDANTIYPFITVRGNNDYLIENDKCIMEVKPLRIMMVHGHKMLLTTNNMVRHAKLNNCNFFIYGHTHKPFYEKIDDVHILNPGALNYPRTPLGQTYAVITISDDESIKVEIKQL